MEHLNKTALTLKINIEDKDAKDVSSLFINDLTEKFDKFNKDYKKEYKKLKEENVLNNLDYQFCPEILQKKSPLTILNAPWGTGKTWFVENLIKLLIKKEIESKKFNKIILIDAWKYSNSKNVAEEFSQELSEKLVLTKLENYDETIKEVVKRKFMKKLSFSPYIKYTDQLGNTYELGVGISSKSTEESLGDKKKIDEAWKNLELNETPILLFIDNLERLGSYYWDLLKSIIKLQEFPNFFIILPLNINKISSKDLNKVENFQIREYPIEKYIDLPCYNLEQNYIGFLKNYFKNKFNSRILNNLFKIFNIELNFTKLSIRQIQFYFEKFNIKKIENEYDLYALIFLKIWKAEDVIKKIIINDLNHFINNKAYEEKIYNDFFEIINYENGLLYFDDNSKSQAIFELQNYNINKEYSFSIKKNYLKDFKEMQKIIKKNIQNTTVSLEKKLLDLKSLLESIDELDKLILNNENEKKELEEELKIENENFNKSLDNSKLEKISLNEIKINKIESKIESLKNEKITEVNFSLKFSDAIKNEKNKLTGLNNLITKIDLKIKEYKTKFNKYYEFDNENEIISDFKLNFLLNYICNNFNNNEIHELKNKKYSNFENIDLNTFLKENI